jgi:hypothetical protein
LSLAVLLFGAVAGEYAAVVFCAFAGSLWALSKAPTTSRLEGLFLIVRLVLTAVVLTAPLAWWAEAQYGIEAHKLVAAVAFAIGALGDRWPFMLSSAWDKIQSRYLGGRDK